MVLVSQRSSDPRSRRCPRSEAAIGALAHQTGCSIATKGAGIGGRRDALGLRAEVRALRALLPNSVGRADLHDVGATERAADGTRSAHYAFASGAHGSFRRARDVFQAPFEHTDRSPRQYTPARPHCTDRCRRHRQAYLPAVGLRTQLPAAEHNWGCSRPSTCAPSVHPHEPVAAMQLGVAPAQAASLTHWPLALQTCGWCGAAAAALVGLTRRACPARHTGFAVAH